MKRGRVAWRGAIHDVVDAGAGGGSPGDAHIRLANHQLVDPREVVWLPPLPPTERPRTIFAVEGNYADHARDLEFKAPEQPVIFLKGINSLIGHRGITPRPADATYMHYGCGLGVVIGRSARRVTRADAYEYIEGYTVANDYTVRDYLENYYRPNFRVKSRDACTPIGPWLVDAADVRNPMNLRLTTTVNGTVTAARQHRGHGIRHRVPDRLSFRVHDALARRHHPDRDPRRAFRRACG